MWRLTIYQTKPYDSFVSKQEVVYESEHIEELLLMVADLSKLKPAAKTWYEISKVDADTDASKGETE